MKKALLISGGRSVSKSLIEKYTDRFIVVADGGAKILQKYNLNADLLIGDLDSIDDESLKFIKEKNIEVTKFPVKKNLTDTDLCVEYLLENLFHDIVILGALGSRLDHELANINILKKLYRYGITAKIEDDNNEVFYAEKGHYYFVKNDKKYISVVSASENTIYSTVGLEYEVNNLKLDFENPSLGVSNEILDKNGEIEIKSGSAFIILSRD